MFDLGGTFRTREPDETIRALKPILSRFGVSRVANVTGLDCVGVPVWCAVRPLARSLTVSQGKGISHELAAISAIMESVELHHGEQCLPPGDGYSLAEALASDAFVDPTTVPLRSDACFRGDRKVLWIEARNERSGRLVYVPRELADRDSLLTTHRDNLFYSSSNGLASGNSRTEAILHGLAELVERDQIAFWQVRKELGPSGSDTKVDLSSIEDPICRDILGRVFKAGLEVCIWYATTNIGVPVFTCSIWDSYVSTPFPHRSSGHGCHPYKRIAILRAITEALQSRLTHITGGRDDMYWEKYRKVLPTYLKSNREHLENIRQETAVVSFETITEAPPLYGMDDLASWLMEAVFRDANADCLVVDLSDSSLPICVVQVIVPGLELSVKHQSYSPGARMMSFLKGVGVA